MNHVKAVPKARQLVRWFFVAGSIGVLTAIAMYALGAVRVTRPFVVRAVPYLCPEMILGLAEPSSPGAILLLLGWVFATNFVIYGLAGLLLFGGRAGLGALRPLRRSGPKDAR